MDDSSPIVGHIRIRAKSQGMCLTLGDKLSSAMRSRRDGQPIAAPSAWRGPEAWRLEEGLKAQRLINFIHFFLSWICMICDWFIDFFFGINYWFFVPSIYCSPSPPVRNLLIFFPRKKLFPLTPRFSVYFFCMSHHIRVKWTTWVQFLLLFFGSKLWFLQVSRCVCVLFRATVTMGKLAKIGAKMVTVASRIRKHTQSLNGFLRGLWKRFLQFLRVFFAWKLCVYSTRTNFQILLESILAG